MHVIDALDIDDAYRKGLTYLAEVGVERDSRYGKVLVAPESVTTHFIVPHSRVLFNVKRNANPFFHLFEALWMLTGANDVEFPAYFVKRMATFSDDGHVFHGAYGHRWRHWRHPDEPTEHRYSDQLEAVVSILKANHDDRRAIIQMWDPERDLKRTGKDFPCNTTIKLEVGTSGALNMTVFCRSNDIVWGCYGANAVHFSVLLEYMAARIGVPMGWYEQVSTNFHAYLSTWRTVFPHSPVRPARHFSISMALVSNKDAFDAECYDVVDFIRRQHIVPNTYHFENKFFTCVARPMAHAYSLYKDESDILAAISRLEVAIDAVGKVDWLVAAQRWLTRLYMRRTTETG